MWIYSTTQEILDAIFFAKRKLLAIFCILLLTLLIWFVIPLFFESMLVTSRADFIQTHDIVVTEQGSTGQYGHTETHYYALFAEQYLVISKDTTCIDFKPTDFTTWCDVLPKSY